MPEVMSRDGTRIDYERLGSGSAVILMADTRPEAIAALARGLARDFSVLVYERGARDGAAVIDDIAALMAAEGGKAYLFASGAGAVPALQTASALPRQISALGLYLPHGEGAGSGRMPPAHWQNAIMPVLVIDGDQALPERAAEADWIVSGLHNGERITLADQGEDFDPPILAPLLNVFFQLGSVQVH